MADRSSKGPPDLRNHRAAWSAAQARETRSEWEYHFTADQLIELRTAAERALAAHGHDAKRLRGLTKGDVPLPLLAPYLARWVQDLESGRGFVFLRGIPVDLWPSKVIEAAYLVLGAHIGALVSQNAFGDLLVSVRDDGANPNDPNVRLYRTRAAQAYHVDGSDVVGLLCLKPAQSGGTSHIASSVSIYNAIRERRPDLFPILSEPFYFDSHGQQRPGEKPYFVAPLVFDSSPEKFRFFFLDWYITNAQRHPEVPRLRPDQRELIQLVLDLAASDEFRLDMDFRPGDIQLLSNHVILHARGAYEDFDEPEKKRHLLRLWLTLHRNAVDGKGSGGIEKTKARDDEKL